MYYLQLNSDRIRRTHVRACHVTSKRVPNPYTGWAGKGWGWGILIQEFHMWGFEVVARVSEFTSAESAAKDSCIRLWQISFVVPAARAQPEREVA